MIERGLWAIAMALVIYGGQAMFFPAYHPPDELEHLAFAESYRQGLHIKPSDRRVAREWGIETIQRPLYYWCLGTLLRIGKAPVDLNPDVNMGARHEFPHVITPGNRALWLGRALSVCLGMLFALGAWHVHRTRATRGLAIVLTCVWVFAPHSVQVFSSVTNEGALWVSLIWALALGLDQRDRGLTASTPWQWGALIVLGWMIKITSLLFIPIWVWLIAGNLNRERAARRPITIFLVSLGLGFGAFVTMQIHRLGDLSGQGLMRQMTPAFFHDASVREMVGPVIDELVSTLLLDWGHHAIQWSWGSFLFVGLTLLGVIIAASQKQWNHAVVGMTGVVLAFLFLLWVSLEMANVQTRHVWPLWSLSLLVWLVIKRIKLAFRVSIVLLALMVCSWLVGWNEVTHADTNHAYPDCSYQVFRNAYVKDPVIAYAYLKSGSTQLMDAAIAFEQRNYRRSYQLASEILDQYGYDRARLIAAESALNLRMFQDVRLLTEPKAQTDPRFARIWVALLIAEGDEASARAFEAQWVSRSNKAAVRQ